MKHFLVVGLTVVLGVIPLLLPAPEAQAKEQSDLAACRALTDAAQRLSCYDALAIPGGDHPVPLPGAASSLPVADALHGPPTAVASPPLGAAMVTTPEHFGSEALPRAAGVNAPANILSAHVVGHVADLAKGHTVTLDNGQIWLCIDDRRYEDYEAIDPAVTIERNFMGTYWMQLSNSQLKIKVRRIR